MASSMTNRQLVKQLIQYNRNLLTDKSEKLLQKPWVKNMAQYSYDVRKLNIFPMRFFTVPFLMGGMTGYIVGDIKNQQLSTRLEWAMGASLYSLGMGIPLSIMVAYPELVALIAGTGLVVYPVSKGIKYIYKNTQTIKE